MAADYFFIFIGIVFAAALARLLFANRALTQQNRALQKIVDEQHTDDDLREREHLLRALLDNAPGPIALKDRDANFLIVNRHFANIHGRTPDEVVGMNVRDLYPPEKAKFFLDHDRELLASGKVSLNEVEAIDDDGKRVVYLTQRFPVLGDEGSIVAIGTTNTIITTLKEAEAELTRYRDYLEDLVRERTAELEVLNDQKDKFFSIIAHDLRGPFNALLGYSRILSRDISRYKQHQVVEFAGTMNEAAEIVFTLLENLLEWSRLQMEGAEVAHDAVDLKKLIDRNLELFRSVAASKNISISSETPDRAMVNADTDMVDAILRNLINNALKFTPSGGNVSVKVQTIDGEVRTDVTDNGVGIPAEDVNNMFRLDRKTSTTGTDGETGSGLGLQLCKELAEKQGGSLHIQSELNAGTKISFDLPGWQA
jgi:PAS domain S-box-containing protein